ncbi:MAG TPA: propanediol utilization protein [Ruminococcaceae bacterium]|nr:propanediol utilization protein [Oscillospiraceae bacterium]
MPKITVPVEILARHVRLSSKGLRTLFGEDYQLTPKKPFSQPASFIAEECLHIDGPRSAFDNVTIIGPLSNATQAILSRSDALALGLEELPVCLPGKSGGGNIKLVGPKGALLLKDGTAVSKRLLFVNAKDATKLHLEDEQVISAQVNGPRGLTFHDVHVFIGEDFRTILYINMDDANAAGLGSSAEAELLI